jgi:PAS domain S-box-containing protein
MLEQEFALRAELGSTWAIRPIVLTQHDGRAALILEDQRGLTLNRILETAFGPMEMGLFLRLAIGLAAALREMHARGLIHKNIKPAHIVVDAVAGRVWLTGFGIASRLRRERQTPVPPETVAGTLAYMAPEQTGRMNRSIDVRSDLYALGVTLYEMATGALPFAASDPMEWVHCHIARQAVSPSERAPDVPATVSTIVMTLLAKTAEDRYQTAAGLEHDLRRCLAQFEVDGRVDDFAVREHDTPDRLMIPEKLYGRTGEIDTLLAAFDRIVQGGPPELVLVSGHSGIGKSSVVHELHKVLVPPRGLFAAGKFDQYKRDIPYSTMAQAFESLVRPLLGKHEDELAPWREAFREALGPNGQLMVDLVPELKLLIGEQAPLQELPPQDAQRRFQLVLRRFLSVFARPEHPLALFLDDLQWLDAATLELLEDLMTQPDLHHLLLVGAYRDNEVTAAHPLRRTLAAIRRASARVREITLTPLAREDVGQLIADSLHSERERVAALATLTHEKTEGNPFFVIQFLHALVDEGLVEFDHRLARWVWDVTRIQAKGYTDNLVDFMVDKLSRLPTRTKQTLQQLACLGNSADITILAMLRDDSADARDPGMEDALRIGLVFSSGGSYRFLHDRVQEAAYSQIPEGRRAEMHLRIGRLLATRSAPDHREEAIFEIVNQLNRGAALITARDEKEQLAEFNLIAGKRAKASTAYASSLTYLLAGAALLGGDGWERRPDLMLALDLNRAECEFLTGELAAAEERLTVIASRATDPVDAATVACLRIDLYTTVGRSERAVDVCLIYLRRFGIDWSPHPTEDEARREYDQMWALLGGRQIESLIDLPLMSHPEFVASLDVLTKALDPALFTDANLFSLLICRMVNLSLEHGNTDASAYAYVHVGTVAGPRYGDYQAGFRFGRLGYDLVERGGFEKFRARTCSCFGVYIIPWTQHLRAGQALIRRAFDAANAVGDLTYVAYARHDLIGNLLAAGESLADIQREAEDGLEFATTAGFRLAIDVLTTQLALVRTLRGLTPRFGNFDDAKLDELQFESHLSGEPGLAMVECWYWTRKLQARFLAGNYAAAVEASSNAERLLWASPSFFETVEMHFYGALSHAASVTDASAAKRSRHLEALDTQYRQLAEWAQQCCPENFESRASLVAAEVARIQQRDLDAERLYEQAIKSARQNAYVHIEALADELAARFYTARGFETISQTYLRNARSCYLRWGADAKVRQLDQLHPYLKREEPGAVRTGTIAAPLEQIDLATVIEVSQTVAGEMNQERLLDVLMRTAIEHAGAERAVMILQQDQKQRIVAEAVTGTDKVVVHLRDEPVTASMVPESIFRSVLNTQENIILDDASVLNSFSRDVYVIERRARSILCLALSNQGKLIGVLYLENNLAPGVFHPGRIAVLKLIASQAAISLENTRLYRELAEREGKIRRLVDANIVGIFIWELEGRILEANDAFLAMVGYDRADLAADRLHWKALTPADWRAREERMMPGFTASGTMQPFEKEYFRKDGSRVPVLIGLATFEESANQGVAFVLDLTERKRAQEAINRAGAELAHMSRVTTLGALTASIAHEINQPLAGIITNAGTCLRMLDAVPADVDGARETARRTIRDGNRASDVIKRLRVLFSKREWTPELLDLNEATREVIALSANDLQRNRIILRSVLDDDLPLVTGDRVQLQQVILNLVRNAAEAMVDISDRPREMVVTTQQETEGRVRLVVRDAGIGLSPEGLESLFDAFYSTKSGGMGIGLFVSRSIIERHHGRLWAESNEMDRGATFSFSIPSNAETDSERAAV